jgi:alkylation response protein AidB-like acyl-CoA dehydrogenase
VLDVEDFRVRARAWLADSAPSRTTQRSPYDVSVFSRLSHDEEAELLTALRAWQARKFEAGYGALTWPADDFGAGLTPAHQAAFRAEESRAVDLPRHELMSVTVNLIAPTVRLYAGAELREILLPGLLDGSLTACQLFSEPGAGSDLAAVATKGRRVAEGWVLDGQKVWTSGAQFAEWGQALVRTEPDAGKHAGLTAFMVPMDAPGVEIRQIRQMSGGASFNEVFLSGVVVPDEYRLGEPGEGWAVTRATLGFERANASNKAGVGGSFAQLLELARSSGALRHRDVRTQLAEILLRERAAEISALREQRALAQGAAPGASGSMRKLQWVIRLGLVSELARTLLADRLLADTGEPGTFSWNDHVLGAPGYRIAGGTDQIQRTIVAERHLGLPAEPKPARRDEQGARR